MVRLRGEQAQSTGRRALCRHRVRLLCREVRVGPWESARVRIDGSGAVEVLTASLTVGQGVETVLAQICAEQLDVPPSKIRVTHGDTALIPRGAELTAAAARSRAAARCGKQQASCERSWCGLRRIGWARNGKSMRRALEVHDGRVGCPGTDIAMTFRELAQAAMPGQPMPPGMEPGLDISSYFVVDKTPHPYGTHVAWRKWTLSSGRSSCSSTRHLLMTSDAPSIPRSSRAARRWIRAGSRRRVARRARLLGDAQLLTGSFMEYLLPTAAEMPLEIDICLLENAPSPLNALGLKGAGEGGTVGVGAAIANAVEDALAPLGSPHRPDCL
jgi:CO/xanthine dehydrogenase Mo-binding subunit